jgi:methyl-accepting chemotaxis protein
MITATSALQRDGEKTGVVTIDIGLKELTDYVESIKVTEIKDYSLSLLTQRGLCIANKDSALIGKEL